MADEIWKIKIGGGLGPLYFGQEQDSALDMASTYGAATEAPMIGSHSELFEALRQSLGEAEALAAMEVLEEEKVDLSPRRIFVFETGVHLTFLEGVLEDIMLDSRARLAHLDEQRPFALDPFPFLQAVQDANGTLPFLDGDDLYFSKIHATAFQFLIRTQGGRLRSTATDTDEASQKTFAWRNDPRDANESLKKYVPVDMYAEDG